MVKKTGEASSEVKVEEVSTPIEPDALQSQIDTLKVQLEDAEKTMKGHQRLSEERLTKLREAEAGGARISVIEKQMEVLLAMQADLVDRGESFEEETPRKRRSEEYLSKLSKGDTPKAETPYEVGEALRLVQSAEMNFDSSEELAKAYRLFSRGLNAEGLEETRRVVNEKSKTVEEKNVELSDEDKEKIARDWFEKSGKNISDTGKPLGSGRTFTREQIADPVFYKENREAIWEADAKGNIT